MRGAGWKLRVGGAALGLALAAGAARAGPPYVTDDPAPTDTGHWEIYNFVAAAHTPGDTAGEGGLDLNYGAAPNLQLTAVIPGSYDDGRFGAGVLELAVKYKFLHQSAGTWTPDVAFFPRAFVPTGAGFDPVRPGLLLPLWAGKDFGPWSLFGGGGLMLNPGKDQRNYWTGGLAVTRDFGDRFQLGAEIYHQTASARDQLDFTGVNLGAIWKFAAHWSLLASGGPGVQNARRQGQYDFYAALEATY
jgi:hypothetical protein